MGILALPPSDLILSGRESPNNFIILIIFKKLKISASIIFLMSTQFGVGNNDTVTFRLIPNHQL